MSVMQRVGGQLSGHLRRSFAAILATLVTTEMPAAAGAPYTYYVAGNPQGRTPARTSAGLLLVGGGAWDEQAFRWFGSRAGHGHVVIISASGGGDHGEELYRRIGGVESAETIEFHARQAAYDSRVLAILRHADGIFIAGGDQANYVRFWKDTPVARLLDGLFRRGKPIGGTSAGLAILGAYSYGAMDGGSIDSAAALRDPAGPAVTIVTDFLHLPFLSHVITDTHLTARGRLGRLIAFVARVRWDHDPKAVGLGVDEGSALAIDAQGNGRLFTTTHGFAWLVQPGGIAAISRGKPLDYPRVRITGIGPKGGISLRTGRVSDPAFSGVVSVRSGRLVNVPGPKNASS